MTGAGADPEHPQPDETGAGAEEKLCCGIEYEVDGNTDEVSEMTDDGAGELITVPGELIGALITSLGALITGAATRDADPIAGAADRAPDCALASEQHMSIATGITNKLSLMFILKIHS